MLYAHYTQSINTINGAEKTLRLILGNPHFPPKVQDYFWQRLCRLKQEHKELFGSLTL
jgi:hypothetical protein